MSYERFRLLRLCDSLRGPKGTILRESEPTYRGDVVVPGGPYTGLGSTLPKPWNPMKLLVYVENVPRLPMHIEDGPRILRSMLELRFYE